MRGSFRTRVRVAVTAVLVVAASLVASSPPGAQADLQNPRQDFLRNAQGGLFIHWGERTSPQHTNCTTWENDVLGGGWNATYWVNEAKKLHVQYIVLDTFHSRLGYARPWPSAIPGSCGCRSVKFPALVSAITPSCSARIHQPSKSAPPDARQV